MIRPKVFVVGILGGVVVAALVKFFFMKKTCKVTTSPKVIEPTVILG